jgi:hypothetical protein
LVVLAIILWNTIYLEPAINALRGVVFVYGLSGCVGQARLRPVVLGSAYPANLTGESGATRSLPAGKDGEICGQS